MAKTKGGTKQQNRRGPVKKKKSKAGGVKNPPMASTVVVSPSMRGAGPHDMLNGMCNPFSDAAHGCKYPDGTASSSIAMQGHGFATLGVNAQGTGIVQFITNMPTAYVASTTLTGTTPMWNFSGSAWQKVSNALVDQLINVDGGFYRINCAGIVIRCSQNAMQAQGSMIISRTPWQVALATDQWLPGNMTSTSTKVVPIVAGAEYVVLFQPQGQGARNFTSSSMTGQLPYWDTIVVEMQGATPSATNVITVEYCYNMEIAPRTKDQSYFEFATKSPPANPFMTTLISGVTSTMNDVFEGGLSAFGGALKSQLRQALAGSRLASGGARLALMA